METLKPCPFCGGETTLETWVAPNGDSGKLFSALCEPCGITARWNTRDAVIEAWNTRATDPDAIHNGALEEILHRAGKLRRKLDAANLDELADEANAIELAAQVTFLKKETP